MEKKWKTMKIVWNIIQNFISNYDRFAFILTNSRSSRLIDRWSIIQRLIDIDIRWISYNGQLFEEKSLNHIAMWWLNANKPKLCTKRLQFRLNVVYCLLSTTFSTLSLKQQIFYFSNFRFRTVKKEKKEKNTIKQHLIQLIAKKRKKKK